jgi:hypothetical protein
LSERGIGGGPGDLQDPGGLGDGGTLAGHPLQLGQLGLDVDVRESLLGCMVEGDPLSVPGDLPNLAAELFDLRRLTGRAAADRKVLDAITERLASGRAHPRVLIVATAEALFDEGRRDKALRCPRPTTSARRSSTGRATPISST